MPGAVDIRLLRVTRIVDDGDTVAGGYVLCGGAADLQGAAVHDEAQHRIDAGVVAVGDPVQRGHLARLAGSAMPILLTRYLV